MINITIHAPCTDLAYRIGRHGAERPLRPCTRTEVSMLRKPRNNARDGVVSLAGNDAAARCAVGLLVVLVLLLSNV